MERRPFVMSNHNTMSKVEFCIEHIIWGVITFLWYRSLFRCIRDYTLAESRLILCVTLVLVSVIYGLLEFNNERNGLSIFLNLASGYGLYTVFSYIQLKSRLIQISLNISTILSAVCLIYIMSRRIRNRNQTRKILIRRLSRLMKSIQTIYGFGLAAIVIVIGLNVILGNSILHSNVDAVQNNNEDQSLENNIETVALLEESRWKELSVQKRVDVLQVVANIEQRYLGLPNELNVGAANLREGLLGYYTDGTHEIILNINSLLYDSPEEVLNSLCHEAYHSYQYRMVEAYVNASESTKNLLLYRRAESYKDEFNNYIDGKKDPCLYYSQKCEKDARDYATSAVEDYIQKINAYYGS